MVSGIPPLTTAYALGSRASIMRVTTAEVLGVSSLGLTTAVLPPAMAPMRGCRTSWAGKFEGLCVSVLASILVWI